MPVRVKYDIRRLTQNEFASVAYQVMAHLFEIHEKLGRLFDEEVYQKELLQCLPDARGEVPVQVTFDSFSKTYYLDVLFQGSIFELKAVESLAPRHRSQLLNYLLLTGSEHGKLVNLRRERIQHEFVNTSLTPTDRTAFSIHDCDWHDSNSANLKTWMIALLHDLGTGLDLDLYREAAMHRCSPESSVSPIPVYGTNRKELGTQEQYLLNAETALRISALDPEDSLSLENHLRRFLAHSSLRAIQWINITRPLVSFRSICR